MELHNSTYFSYNTSNKIVLFIFFLDSVTSFTGAIAAPTITGMHGFHLHTGGSCLDIGGHYNPTGVSKHRQK